MLLEECTDDGEDAALGCGREPVALARQQADLVSDRQSIESSVQGMSLGHGDDVILLAMEDECGGESGRRGHFIRGHKATGDLDDGANPGAVRSMLRGVSEREERSQRDADESDSGGIHARSCSDGVDHVGDRFQPERDVASIGKQRWMGAIGPCPVEIMDRVNSDTEGCRGG